MMIGAAGGEARANVGEDGGVAGNGTSVVSTMAWTCGAASTVTPAAHRTEVAEADVARLVESVVVTASAAAAVATVTSAIRRTEAPSALTTTAELATPADVAMAAATASSCILVIEERSPATIISTRDLCTVRIVSPSLSGGGGGISG